MPVIRRDGFGDIARHCIVLASRRHARLRRTRARCVCCTGSFAERSVCEATKRLLCDSPAHRVASSEHAPL